MSLPALPGEHFTLNITTEPAGHLQAHFKLHYEAIELLLSQSYDYNEHLHGFRATVTSARSGEDEHSTLAFSWTSDSAIGLAMAVREELRQRWGTLLLDTVIAFTRRAQPDLETVVGAEWAACDSDGENPSGLDMHPRTLHLADGDTIDGFDVFDVALYAGDVIPWNLLGTTRGQLDEVFGRDHGQHLIIMRSADDRITTYTARPADSASA
ncbi:hypothetical protein [Dietzia sp. 179-F 9C3 NHS]|uniref:hypothetical protein n=1 Tax=Dietzia sp. 179-F 9C3 NHS TaxID=3374295 RepID=UPI00387A1CB5